MKRNVLMKKNKILALALAAAMALTSAPMSTVYAEEETPITNEADGGG